MIADQAQSAWAVICAAPSAAELSIELPRELGIVHERFVTERDLGAGPMSLLRHLPKISVDGPLVHVVGDQREAFMLARVHPERMDDVIAEHASQPYFNLDGANMYRRLDEVRHRGIEGSLSGDVT